MTIYNKIFDTRIREFLDTAPRYKFMVIKKEEGLIEPLSFDLGHEFSMAVRKLDRQSHYFQMQLREELSGIFNKHIRDDKEFGNFLIVSNPGILFEPELKLNVCEILRRISQNNLLIIIWPGAILPDRLCNGSEQSKYCIKRSEINYDIL